MAVKIWGGGTNDPPLGNDWPTANNWTGDAVPVANDDVVFNGEHGNQDCTTMPGEPWGFALNSLRQGPNFTGAIGNPGGGFKVKPTSIGNLYLSGTGAFYLDTTVTTAQIRNTSLTPGECEIDGHITDDFIILRGLVTLVTGFNARRIFSGFIESRETDVSLTIPAGVALNTIIQMGGLITNSSDLGVLVVQGGQFRHEAGDLTDLTLTEGTVFYNADGGTYTLALANLYGGLFSTAEDPLPKVITQINAWRPASLDFRNLMNNISITNPINSFGAYISADEDSTITIV